MEKLTAAHLYDARTRSISSDLHAIGMLTKEMHNVLEVGAGTGRIVDYLARHGACQVTGVEKDVEKAKIARKNTSRWHNTQILDEDFFNHCPKKKYDGILFTFNVFQELLEIEERIEALCRAGDMLTNNGRIILFNFLHDFAGWAAGEKKTELSIDSPAHGKWRCTITCKRNHARQVSSCEVVYKPEDSTQDVIIDRYSLALVTRNEMLLLFRLTGMRLLREYGSYTLEALTKDSDMMIHVLVHH